MKEGMNSYERVIAVRGGEKPDCGRQGDIQFRKCFIK